MSFIVTAQLFSTALNSRTFILRINPPGTFTHMLPIWKSLTGVTTCLSSQGSSLSLTLSFIPSSTQLPPVTHTDLGRRFICEWNNFLSQPFHKSVLWSKKWTPTFLANNHFHLAVLCWYSRSFLKVLREKTYARLLDVNWCQDNNSQLQLSMHKMFCLLILKTPHSLFFTPLQK